MEEVAAHLTGCPLYAHAHAPSALGILKSGGTKASRRVRRAVHAAGFALYAAPAPPVRTESKATKSATRIQRAAHAVCLGVPPAPPAPRPHSVSRSRPQRSHPKRHCVAQLAAPQARVAAAAATRAQGESHPTRTASTSPFSLYARTGKISVRGFFFTPPNRMGISESRADPKRSERRSHVRSPAPAPPAPPTRIAAGTGLAEAPALAPRSPVHASSRACASGASCRAHEGGFAGDGEYRWRKRRAFASWRALLEARGGVEMVAAVREERRWRRKIVDAGVHIVRYSTSRRRWGCHLSARGHK
ncbi:hypothetical protein C8J57DRAFT_1460145 [Mycena rebaudengoi]|nr:hypothetical protein C8J57DRAFT_1460145 [Mycena rebaudengoi]